MTVFDREAAAGPRRPDPLSPEPQDEVLRLFADQATALYRFCRSLVRTREEAEDVVQETLLKLRHLQADGDRRNLRAWLFTVAANGCRARIWGCWRWVPWNRRVRRSNSVASRLLGTAPVALDLTVLGAIGATGLALAYWQFERRDL
jgi:DNA-directed RNA polymerase specialized sigma24 family protein